MTRIAIVRPTDRLEDRRYTTRLLHAGLSRVDVDRGYIESTTYHGVLCRETLAVADATGRVDVLDVADVDRLRFSEDSTDDTYVRHAAEALRACVSALQSPTHTGVECAFAQAATVLGELNRTTLMFDPLADCARALFDDYRTAVTELWTALGEGFDAWLDPDAIERTPRDVEAVVEVVFRHVDDFPPQVRTRLGEEECETRYFFAGVQFWSTGCGIPTTFSLSR